MISRAASAPGSRRAMPVTARATAGAQRCDSVRTTAGAASSRNSCGIGAAVTEYRLVRIAGDDAELRARGQHPNQPGGLRIEVLSVVDQQQLNACALGGQQLVVHGERLQCGTDEFGRAERGHRGLWRRHADRRAQQHHLLVDLGEPAGGHPLGAPGPPPDALQLKRIHSAFGAACQQVAQFGGEPDGQKRRPQLCRPADRRVVTVLEVTGQQFADDAVLLGAGDQPRRRIPVAPRRLTEHREGVGVHRPDQRLAHRHRPRGAVAQ